MARIKHFSDLESHSLYFQRGVKVFVFVRDGLGTDWRQERTLYWHDVSRCNMVLCMNMGMAYGLLPQ